MAKPAIIIFIFGLAAMLVFSCSTLQNGSRTPSAETAHWLLQTPEPENAKVNQLLKDYEKRKLQVFKKNNSVAVPTPAKMAQVARYLDFLKLPEPEKLIVQNRLFESSTQFLFCAPDDWACLESSPELTQLAQHRVDSVPGLGTRHEVAGPLNLEYFFTEQWYRSRKNQNTEQDVKIREHADIANELQKVISKNWQRVSMAIYGIDGIGEVDSKTKQINNSMQEVFKAIKSQPNARAVVDIENYKSGSNGAVPAIIYQYPTTSNLYEFMNQNADAAQMKLRLEWPAANIMHNKFFVFEDHNHKSVWTGTANISKNCMGDEDFANMAVYIKNSEVAGAFLTEFEEMFDYAPQSEIKAPMRVGRFHQNKKPNTKRYFSFSDGTELSLHFSPTDDGEHRAILPLILSAGAGDVLRVSMFGSGGAEYVRALQFAAAKGALVKVFVDRDTSFQISTSWINRKSQVRLQGVNPYGVVKGKLEIKHTDWGAGNMDHHKSATLTRKTAGGMVPLALVVGSQNWSVAGNDENDENMIVLRNSEGLQIVKDYNRHFDTLIWPTGKSVAPE